MSPSRLRTLTPLATLAPGEHEMATVRAPFTGEPLAELPLAGPADLDHTVGIARVAQAEWASIRARERADILPSTVLSGRVVCGHQLAAQRRIFATEPTVVVRVASACDPDKLAPTAALTPEVDADRIRG